MNATTPTTTGENKTTRTGYHILKRIELGVIEQNATGAGKTVYELVHEGLEATSAQAAIRHYATGKPGGKHDKAIEGSYVAVPSRSFTETIVKVETQTIVKLA